MASRFDVLRSLVRGATKATRDRLKELGPVANAREVFEELRARRAHIGEGALGSAIAQAEGVRTSTVRIADGRLLVDVGWDDGDETSVAVTPETVRFAPRGAKEVLFSVEPPERVGDARVREIVGCLAAAIARALWGPLLGPRPGGEQALVEREGARLRADLRTVPAVRSMLEGSTLSMALDVIAIESFTFEDHALRFRIALPFSMPR